MVDVLLFSLSRMAVRAGVLVAAIATVMSVASGVAAQGQWDTIEEQATEVIDWLDSVIERITGTDFSLDDVTVADLLSPRTWADTLKGWFGFDAARADLELNGSSLRSLQERQPELYEVLDGVDVAALIDAGATGTPAG